MRAKDGLKPVLRNYRHSIQRACHRDRGLVHHMRINHRRLQRLMSQQLLHLPNVISVFQQMRREKEGVGGWELGVGNA
jgi:hypothetical protein